MAATQDHRYFSPQDSFWAVFSHSLYVALGIHAFLCVVFFGVGAAALGWFNVGSVLVYTLCLSLVRRGRRRLPLSLAWAEVLCHTLLATLLLGWDSGFHYYLLILASLVFLSTLRIRQCVCYVVGTGLIYIELNILAGTMTAAPLPDNVLAILRYINMMLAIATIALVSYLYRTSVKAAVGRLEWLASTDPLTGLKNRREFMRIAAQSAAQPGADDLALCFILADVDNFKRINDAYGHEAGDNALVAIGDQLRKATREDDLVARWGGEEFLIMLPGTDLDAASVIAERARNAIAQLPFEAGGVGLSIGVTFGVYQRASSESLDACIARADDALRAGKRQGKNRVRISDACVAVEFASPLPTRQAG